MEYRDLYDENRNFTGKIIEKNEPVPEGYYYITVVIFIQDSMGKFLMQKRSDCKGGKWATTGGHPKSGESSLEGLVIEIKEELGLDIDDSKVKLFKTVKTNDDFYDLYYLKMDIDLKSIILQEEEVSEVKLLTTEEINELMKNGEFNKGHYHMFKDCLEYLLQK